MIRYSSILRRIAYWTIPLGIYNLIKEKQIRVSLSDDEQQVLNQNSELANTHEGDRCFILATGPSIKKQNLVNLKNEWCFGVSDFYKHQDFQEIKPSYFCLAPMHHPFTDHDGIRRFNEISTFSNKIEIFFVGLSDKGLLERSNLPTDRIHYIRFVPLEKFPVDLDLTKNLPNVSSVSIMALWIAIYMGFSEIYLLGCDHNNIWTWDGVSNENQLEHFYNGTPSIGYQHPFFDVDRALHAHLKVREQYKWCHQLALSRKIKIFNASPLSYINIFPRINLEEVIDA
jgi:hypothetical protein